MAGAKQLKNKKFAEAARQIEEAMIGNDAVPLDGGPNAVRYFLGKYTWHLTVL